MPEGFVSMAAWMRGPVAVDEQVVEAQPEFPTVACEDAPQNEPVAQEDDDMPEALLGDLCSDVRRFRAALADALDYSVAQLVRDIAVDVLGRELQLAPSDLAAIVARARRRFSHEEPVAIRVHPDDVSQLDVCDLRIVADAKLRRGDAILDLSTGTIDASLGVRLESLLQSHGAA